MTHTPATKLLADSVIARTYGRNTLGNQIEDWNAICDRVVPSILKEGKLNPEEALLVDQYARSKKATPAGRVLWVGGTKWAEKPKNYPGQYNCLHGSTPVLTPEGFVPIFDLLVGSTEVVNREGRWSKVQFRSYGIEEIYRLRLKSYNEEMEVLTTANHRWFPMGFGETPTKDLRVGMSLNKVYPHRPQENEEYLFGVLHGVYYGDGTRKKSSSRQSFQYQVRLCGDKSSLLDHPAFAESPVTYPPSFGGDPMAYANSYLDHVLPGGDLKALPSVRQGKSYLLGFFRGLLATNGCCHFNRRLSVNINGQQETIEFLKKILPIIGVKASHHSYIDNRANYGDRNSVSHCLNFAPYTLVEEDFLRDSHKENWVRYREAHQPRPTNWKVVEISPTGELEEVFCCEEPETSGFVLEGFLETGNCNSGTINSWEDFKHNFDFLMQGTGSASVSTKVEVSQLPEIENHIELTVYDSFGAIPEEDRRENTATSIYFNEEIGAYEAYIIVGDSRQGWAVSLQRLLEATSDYRDIRSVVLDCTNVRKQGEKIKGFGGTTNPSGLRNLYETVVRITNDAVGRKLTPVECELILCETAKCVIAGNVRRSARLGLFSASDKEGEHAKTDLFYQDKDGNWRIDEKRDSFRMANFTRLFQRQPTLKECVDSVRSQYKSNEGAIAWAGEALARCNADLLNTPEKKSQFLQKYRVSPVYAQEYLGELLEGNVTPGFSHNSELDHRMKRYGLNPCFTGDTLVLTKEGHSEIKDLVGKEVTVWDGETWRTIDNFRVTAENEPVYNVLLRNGQKIAATAYHTFILEDGTRKELKDLKEGDVLKRHNQTPNFNSPRVSGAYLKGFALGDGTVAKSWGGEKDVPLLWVYNGKESCMARLIESCSEIPVDEEHHPYCITEPSFHKENNANRYRMNGLQCRKDEILPWFGEYKHNPPVTEILSWRYEDKLAFIAGYMDADGTASDSKNGFMYQVSSTSYELLNLLQLILETLGVKSSLRQNRQSRIVDFGERGGECECQQVFRLTISQVASVDLSSQLSFSRLTSFARKETRNIHKDKTLQVVGVEYSHVADKVYCCTVPGTHAFSLSNGVLTAQCAEIVGSDFFCNLSLVHLSQINPFNLEEQEEAFRASALMVSALLSQNFLPRKYQESRQLDPIVAVNFTGGFDFFSNLMGSLWLDWWMHDRDRDWDLGDVNESKHPDWRNSYNTIRNLYFAFNPEGAPDATLGEMMYAVERGHYELWKRVVDETVGEYCRKRGLRKPNRTTAVQPGGTKSLITGDTPGWHPPFATATIRRVQFQREHPVALACMKSGLNVIPSADQRDDNGQLLDDPFDPRVTDWLVEFPLRTPYAEMAEQIGFDPLKISALAQFDSAMNVQQGFCGHNVSATISFREDEIATLGERIYQAIRNDEGYISFALMQRWDGNGNMPRLPYQPCSVEEVKELEAQLRPELFHDALAQFLDGVDFDDFAEPKMFCTSQKCEMKF